MRLRSRSLAALLALGGALTAAATAGGGSNGADSGTMCVRNTQLRPANEVRTGPADPVTSTARGKAQIKVREDGTIEYRVTIRNPAGEEFFAGHIHEGAATENGPVRVLLFGGPNTTAKVIRVRGTLSAAEATSANFAPTDVCTNPAGHYVNFHTTDDPMGAIRGQLG